jgi:two-component system CheB/CheR fusion protein
MLKDGSEGLLAIKEAGGVALVQLPQEATYSEMPRNAIVADGEMDFVGTVRAIAHKICDLSSPADEAHEHTGRAHTRA